MLIFARMVKGKPQNLPRTSDTSEDSITFNWSLIILFVAGSLFGLTAVHSLSSNSRCPIRQTSGNTVSKEDGWEFKTRDHYFYAPHENPVFQCNRTLLPPGSWYNPATDYGAPPPAGVRASEIPPGRPTHGEELPGTSRAQRFLHKYQHPKDCSKQRFLVHGPHLAGMGSQLHVYTMGLAVAMTMGRIFLTSYGGYMLYTNGPFCTQGSTVEQCYFESWSNCTLKDAGFQGEHGSGGVEDYGRSISGQGDVKTLFLDAAEFEPHEMQLVPPQLDKLLDMMNVAQKKRFWWWRAQAAAYFVRPNARTLQELEHRRQTMFGGADIMPGTLSVHIRHGDKGIEAPLINDTTFVDLTQDIFELAGDSLKKRIFLSTEDPVSVEHFGQLRRNRSWEVSYTQVPRKPDGGIKNRDYAVKIGPTEEYLNGLLNLQLALDCDAWVGDLASNWNRLIEELRSTVRCKANGIYRDARQPYPPQVFGLMREGAVD